VDGRLSATYQKQAQWLADLHEDLDVLRYPVRLRILRAVEEASQRADASARLDHALEQLSLR
jgi:hypothetical protein